jgi:hypothetical protein
MMRLLDGTLALPLFKILTVVVAPAKGELILKFREAI